MFNSQFYYAPLLVIGESVSEGRFKCIEPDFDFGRVSPNVHMRWFVTLFSIEEEYIWADAEHYGHSRTVSQTSLR